MPKSFPIFPAGLRGAGILIARLSGAALLVSGLAYRPTPSWAELPAVLLALGLAVGAFTRIVAVLAAGLVAVVAYSFDRPLGVVLLLHALNLAAVVLVGGGAYSLDGLLFGRRVIRLGE